MSTDYIAPLPIKTDLDGLDERVHVKIVDYASPGGVDKQVEVSEKLVHVRNFGQDPAGTKVQLKLSEQGYANTQGDYDATTNTTPASSAIVAHDRNAAPGMAQQNKRVTAVAGTNDTVCLDVAIRDESGVPYSATNPMPVTLEESEGIEKAIFNEFEDIAAAANEDFEYTVTALNKLSIDGLTISASGAGKWILSVETAPASAVFNVVGVYFNSPSEKSEDFALFKKVVVAAGVKVKINATNLDNKTQSLYATVFGTEVVA